MTKGSSGRGKSSTRQSQSLSTPGPVVGLFLISAISIWIVVQNDPSLNYKRMSWSESLPQRKRASFPVITTPNSSLPPPLLHAVSSELHSIDASTSTPLSSLDDNVHAIVWMSLPTATDTEDWMIAHYYSSDTTTNDRYDPSSKFLDGMYQVWTNLQFRPENGCNVTESITPSSWCPPTKLGAMAIIPSIHVPSSLTLRIWVNRTELKTGSKPLDLSTIQGVTARLWDPNVQTHRFVFYPRSNLTLSYKSCTIAQRNCPKPCPTHTKESATNDTAIYPILRDPKDGLCKTSDPKALPPRNEFGGKCRCESTCATPAANRIMSTYPWTDQDERHSYLPDNNSEEQLRRQKEERRACEHLRRETPTESIPKKRFWCKGANSSLPCPAYGDASWQLYYIPQAKLVFCGIPKVGITEWIKFFRYLFGANDYLGLPHFKTDRIDFWVSSLPLHKAQELFLSPKWTKAVFVRNPYERLLSAYTDKILRKGFTQKHFGIGNRSAPVEERPILSFAQFVDLVTDNTTEAVMSCKDPRGLKACTDPHWKQQTMMCGLDHLLPHFDFIGNFDHIAEHSKLLLERVGLWDTHGARFDDGRDLLVPLEPPPTTCYSPPPRRYPNETIPGFNQRGASKTGTYSHATGSKSKFDEYYTPDIKEKVRQAYALDFEVWGQVSDRERPVHDVLRGKDLTVVQEYCNQVTASPG